ncbi:hypothetical protein [Kibdelosporangium phytohabitans]|uniref:Uncharacterized protein n=1 Tax=Kibdelosporangium phytohabitans TaxID=860235 RepID=A0A0N9I8J4_9PSEU|nr:hypothetical protein [Kibdelosporangium phytohabitans]ALG10825.1 hypothetical protein AOZ06_31580 [Kibdelosporangium phytohabitans]MBE1461996.1 hypothetical protein [Kibdelosporangium phytohabitans]
MDATTAITDTVARTWSVELVRAGAPRYQSCVGLVRQKYAQRYGAVVDPRPDLFVVAAAYGLSENGSVAALNGLVSCGSAPSGNRCATARPAVPSAVSR